MTAIREDKEDSGKLCSNLSGDEKTATMILSNIGTKYRMIRLFAVKYSTLFGFLVTGLFAMLNFYIQFCLYLYQMGYNYKFSIPVHYILMKKFDLYSFGVRVFLSLLMVCFTFLGYECLKRRTLIKYFITLFLICNFTFMILGFTMGINAELPIFETNIFFELVYLSILVIVVLHFLLIYLALFRFDIIRLERLKTLRDRYRKKEADLRNQINSGKTRRYLRYFKWSNPQIHRKTLKKIRYLDQKIDRLKKSKSIDVSSGNNNTGQSKVNGRYYVLLSLLLSAFFLMFTLVCPLAIGYTNGVRQREFRVILTQFDEINLLDEPHEYIVIYENEDIYLISPGITEDGKLNILTTIQKEIKKTDIVVENKTYKDVK